MPEMIGQRIPGSTQIERNAKASSSRVRLTYAQARLMPEEEILCSLDTTDRGSKCSRAKRWFRWFSSPDAILNNAASTKKMRAAAMSALGDDEVKRRRLARDLFNACVSHGGKMPEQGRFPLSDRCNLRNIPGWPQAPHDEDLIVWADAMREDHLGLCNLFAWQS